MDLSPNKIFSEDHSIQIVSQNFKMVTAGDYSPTGDSFEVDRSALMPDEKDRLSSDAKIVFYNNPVSSCKSVVSDTFITGSSEADETIAIHPGNIPGNIDYLPFTAAVYEAEEKIGISANSIVYILNCLAI